MTREVDTERHERRRAAEAVTGGEYDVVLSQTSDAFSAELLGEARMGHRELRGGVDDVDGGGRGARDRGRQRPDVWTTPPRTWPCCCSWERRAAHEASEFLRRGRFRGCAATAGGSGRHRCRAAGIAGMGRIGKAVARRTLGLQHDRPVHAASAARPRSAATNWAIWRARHPGAVGRARGHERLPLAPSRSRRTPRTWWTRRPAPHEIHGGAREHGAWPVVSRKALVHALREGRSRRRAGRVRERTRRGARSAGAAETRSCSAHRLAEAGTRGSARMAAENAVAMARGERPPCRWRCSSRGWSAASVSAPGQFVCAGNSSASGA
ncbi:hypothetical protein QJS66_14820 [Kocuria rhizophila]|nr:hypothetical protein QJS66_14820 [Kocuria rhizophila]